MKIPFKRTDGGKLASGFNREYRDCTVRAIAIAGHISYSEAHEYMRRSGRKERRGGDPNKGLKLAFQDGKLDYTENFDLSKPVVVSGFLNTWSYPRKKYPTLASIYPKLNKSRRYLLYTSRHAFAIVDGVMNDIAEIAGPRSRIQAVIEIIPKPKLESKQANEPTQTQINDLWARLELLEKRIA